MAVLYYEKFRYFIQKAAQFYMTMLILIVLQLSFFSHAFAFDLKVKVINGEGGKKITELKWASTAPEANYVKREIDGEKESIPEILTMVNLIVKVDGFYSRISQGWTILLQDKPLTISPDGSFHLNFLVKEKIQWAELTAVSEDGTIETEKIGIEIENFDEFISFLREKKIPTFYRASLGYRSLSFSQKNVPNISQGLYDLSADYRRSLTPDEWSGWATLAVQVPGGDPAPNIAKIS